MVEFMQASHKLRVTTRGKGFIEITEELRRWLRATSAGSRSPPGGASRGMPPGVPRASFSGLKLTHPLLDGGG